MAMTLAPKSSTKQTVAVKQGVRYYTEAFHDTKFEPGVYEMQYLEINREMVPGFEPMEVTNDEPLEIDPNINLMVKEIEDFLGRREVFKKMGFAHKRGYLLHGPPGCGKSSTLRLLEKQFVEKFSGIVLFWTRGTVDGHYEEIRKHEPERPVMVVTEDIDRFMDYFEENILEFLDGQKGLDNFVLVATTNNLEEIPSRIKDRPSRVDRLIEVSQPNQEVRYNFLKSAGVEQKLALDLAKKTKGMSIAHLKEIVVATVCLNQDLEPVIKRLRKADMTVEENDE